VAIHVGLAAIPLIWWGSALSRWAILALCLPGLAGVAFDIYRLWSPGANEFAHSLWGGLLKASEANRLTGASHYVLGMLGAVALYPKPAAVCASLYMAWADPAASFVGRHVGRRRVGTKTWEGFYAFAAVAFATGLVFFSWPVALVGAGAAGLMELFTPRWANDNSLIPIGAGFILALLA
jgi:dolichol kinase